MVRQNGDTIRALCVAGDQDALNARVAELLATEASLSLIDVGIILRDHGQPQHGLAVFSHIMAHFPDWVPSYYEAAFLHRLAGNHRAAIRLLRQAHAVEPRNARVLLFLIHMLHAASETEEAERLSLRTELLATDDELVTLEELRQFGLFLRTWPKPTALALMRRNQERYRHATAVEVGAAIIDAVQMRRPFALIRLGDGEGSCINLGPEDEAAFDRLHARNRRELTAIWFGPDFHGDDRAFRSLARRLPRIALDADFVGLPYEGWIEHEYRISSLRGIPTLINIHRAFERLDEPNQTIRSCSQITHVDLAQSDLLRHIIRAAGRIAIISCLPDIAALIRNQLGVSDVEFYRIPGEQGSRGVLGDAIVAGRHFPDVFEELTVRLARPHDGRLFLVAGGILGKFYAATIKQHGGVAVDIGSVVDGWAKKMTRPGLDFSL